MNKKLFSILFTLFLAGILSVSCSNADKTGSNTENNTNTDNDVDNTSYVGTWYGKNQNNYQVTMVIDANGGIVIEDIENQGAKFNKNIAGSGNSYTVTYTSVEVDFTIKVVIEFDSDSAGTVTISESGTDDKIIDVTKQK